MIYLKSLQAKGNSVILFVSHDMVAVRNLCTRVLALGDGCIRHDLRATAGNSDQYRSDQLLPHEASFPLGIRFALGLNVTPPSDNSDYEYVARTVQSFRNG